MIRLKFVFPWCVSVLALACWVIGCSGGPAINGGTGGGTGGTGGGSTGGVAATSGEYLWETGPTQSTLSYSTINATTGALGPLTKLDNTMQSNPSNYPGIVISPSGGFLYTFYSSSSELLTYTMSGPGLVLTANGAAGSTESIPLANSMTMHPGGKFLYVVESGSVGAIQEFSLNTSTGGMTLGASVKENADLRVGTIDPSGKFLFVNDLTGGRIYVYQINQQDGSLSTVTNSPFTLPSGERPTVLAIGGSAPNLFLYASLYSSQGIAAFSISSTTGALTVVPGSPFLTNATSDYIRATPSGKFLYSSQSSDGAVYGLVINPDTGALSPTPGSPYSTAATSITVTIDPAGKFLYVANFKNGTLYGFSLDGTMGALTPLTGSPFPALPQPEGLTMMNIP